MRQHAQPHATTGSNWGSAWPVVKRVGCTLQRAVGLLLVVVLAIGVHPWTAHAEPPKPPPAEAAGTGSYVLQLRGKAVSFDVSGMEPDFDPIYKAIITATLHDRRATAQALPDATLVLSAYLEAFQPDTVPILPDLLHPNQTATDLGGFMTGKAALVNAAGKTVYRGNLLAEVFADSTEHLLVDLYAVNAPADAPAVRLQGVISLQKGGGESGTLRALQPLSHALLAVPRGQQPSWQAVIAGLTVHPPAMLGTAGNAGKHSASATSPAIGSMQHASSSSSRRLSWPQTIGLGAILVALILAGPTLFGQFKRRIRSGRRAHTPSAAATDVVPHQPLPEGTE